MSVARGSGAARPIEVSAEHPDWSREASGRWWDPGRRLLSTLRSFERWEGRGGIAARIVVMLLVARHRFWSAVTGADIPLGFRIGGGLLLPHPNGIVVHPDSKIGPNCLLFQQVTLGTVEGVPGAPVIGGHVDIGAGAKVLGPVRVGDHARIGANAVVLEDVPAGAVAVGVPARCVGTESI